MRFRTIVNGSLPDKILVAGQCLSNALGTLDFSATAHTVYNVFSHAWNGHATFVRRFATSPKRVLFLGMNPGPWGMTQTGVPFGEVAAVRDWMGIEVPIDRPMNEHPKRPVQGFACRRSEVSGRRFWGLFAEHFGQAEAFFSDHFVSNYCPLAFMEESGRNLTPDKLPASVAKPVESACDEYLRRITELLEPAWVVGVGKYAFRQAQRALGGTDVRLASVLHPSPASPAANKDWAGATARTLFETGVWQDS